MKFYVIPNIKELDKWNDLAKKYNLGYEYNDFFNPTLLDNKEELNKRVEQYKSLNRSLDTLHGVFLDINFDSLDSKIKQISIDRAIQSLNTATLLNCKAVIFHTNYQTWIKDKNYQEKWVNSCKEVYEELLNLFPNICIYVENMFDNDPVLLSKLAERLINHPRFGVCLDVAHAHISNTPLNIWFEYLTPYIKHIHLNNNDKVYDSHNALNNGTIDYKYVLDKVLELKDATVLLEMNKLDDVVTSLELIGGEYLDFE